MMGDRAIIVKYVHIASVVSAYWAISISLVFINDRLLSDKDRKLNAPLFITFFQCVVSTLLCLVLSFFSEKFPSILWFPKVGLDFNILRALIPLSGFFVATITFNNLCLKYVGVAFYTVSRSLTTVFNVIFTFLVLRQTTSTRAVLCCAVIVAGFVLGVNQEGRMGSLSVFGVLCGLLASATLSLYSICTKKMLPVVGDSVSLLTYYNNVNALLMFMPMVVLFGEVQTVWNFKYLNDPLFWSFMVVSGVFGFLISYVTMLQIQVTSPLTHNVSGTAKACAQTVLAVICFGQVKSVLWWVSNVLVLLGSASYTRVRQLEMLKQHQEVCKEENRDGKLTVV
ncbi:GDP-fucose transporter 1-like [Ornithodoros turicata]|uniref:GDP-fucose transporter 1-like n=1 Tax=Ornithodoros turicata TaxID=34597 RepID=UPI003139292E